MNSNNQGGSRGRSKSKELFRNSNNKHKKQKTNHYKKNSPKVNPPIRFNIPRFSDDTNNNKHKKQKTNHYKKNSPKVNPPIRFNIPRFSDNTNNNNENIMSYRGYSFKKNNETIDYISPTAITPKEFYNKYVKERRPVVFSSSLDTIDEKWKGTKSHWSNDYLNRLTGNSTIRVEYRENESGRFGEGKEKTMKMKEFLNKIKSGDKLHYLTTQDLKVDEEGRPEMMTSPIVELFNHGEFPLQPSILPNLIPFNLNLWFGNTKEGSSSGLHHDFHDNLYILIRGKKRFRLYSPEDALNMYTKGTIIKVHENGRINYKGQVTRADGADLLSDVALNASKCQDDAEKDLANAEQALRQGKVGAAEWVARAEKRLDDALDSVLSVQMDDNYDDNDYNNNNSNNDKSSDEDKADGPLNFSKINLYLPEKTIQEKFPKFNNVRGTSCEVKSGEMLYLPAGWFHEVTSYSTNVNANLMDGTSGDNNNDDDNFGGHMAFNYWFHPPDNLFDSEENGFASPYKSKFWAQDFQSSLKK